jgi:hypothetical protein
MPLKVAQGWRQFSLVETRRLLMEGPQAVLSLETELVELVLIPHLREHEARRAATS